MPMTDWAQIDSQNEPVINSPLPHHWRQSLLIGPTLGCVQYFRRPHSDSQLHRRLMLPAPFPCCRLSPLLPHVVPFSSAVAARCVMSHRLPVTSVLVDL